MTKARVALLVLLAAGLTSGVAQPRPERAGRIAAVAADPAGPDITGRLGELNPDLSSVELVRIRNAVLRSSARFGLDPLLVTAVIEVESAARPGARSHKGAQGLMQVMPYMMRPMGLAGNASTIEANIEAGCMILAGNIRRLGEADGISAYFWGSEIRGVSYLHRVRAAHQRLRGEVQS